MIWLRLRLLQFLLWWRETKPVSPIRSEGGEPPMTEEEVLKILTLHGRAVHDSQDREHPWKCNSGCALQTARALSDGGILHVIRKHQAKKVFERLAE